LSLLDKLLGRDAKPAADLNVEGAAEPAAAGMEDLAPREDETSPHHVSEREADS
jgi:hypothetical protein